MKTKQCRQCGEIKPIDQFRRYYGGRQGTYTQCKACEKINSRAKYLNGKRELTESERSELDKIYRLYDAQRACGLRPPKQNSGYKSEINLDDMLSKYEAKANIQHDTSTEFNVNATPMEIMNWLTEELTAEPDYYLDEVYDTLVRKYRPVLHIDEATMLPVYDESHATALSKVLERFNKYEDDYYNKEV